MPRIKTAVSFDKSEYELLMAAVLRHHQNVNEEQSAKLEVIWSELKRAYDRTYWDAVRP